MRATTVYANRITKQSLGLLILIALAVIPASASAQDSALIGDLKPGPYAVGFKVIKISDDSRPVRSKQDYFGSPDTADRARQLYVHLWYPAKPGTAAALTFADYIYSSDRDWPQTMSETAKRNLEISVKNRFQGFFGTFTDAAWERLRQTKLLARYDAEAANGRFPLIVGTLRELSTTITNEYLASHGYVSAHVQSVNDRFETEQSVLIALILNNQLRDLELTVSHLRAMPFVDPLKLVTLGFSGSGLAQVLLAMRHPDVDALALLETGIWGPLGSSYTKTPLYDPRMLRVPFFFSYSDSSIGRWPEQQFAEFERLKFSRRHYIKVKVPNFHHWDFATEGMAASTVLSIRGERQSEFRRGFELTNLYLLHFFNAYVKKEGESLALLRSGQASRGLITLEEKPGTNAAPSRDELAAIIAGQGIARAVQVYREARQRDPEAPIFEEQRMSQLANELIQRNQSREAIELFKLNVESHPNSASALTNLGNGYSEAGQREMAVQQFERALALLSSDAALDSNQKERLKASLRQKIDRLK